jgi:hypothetical protein
MIDEQLHCKLFYMGTSRERPPGGSAYHVS